MKAISTLSALWYVQQMVASFSPTSSARRTHSQKHFIFQRAMLSEENKEVVSSSTSVDMFSEAKQKTVNGADAAASRHHQIEEEVTANLGDIMSSRQQQQQQQQQHQTNSGLVTQSPKLAETYGLVNPLDRMALTANGNLQRMVSSFYDAPVSVLVDSCELLHTGTSSSGSNSSSNNSTPERVWSRVVHLQVFGTTFCTAVSKITVYDPLCQELVESGQVGLGQLFRYLDILPSFELHDAAPKAEGGFWRDYSLHCEALSCRIHEDFCPDVWALKPKNDG